MAKSFQRALTKQGFKWKLGFKCNKATVEGDTVKLDVEAAKDGKKETLEANIVLVAAGARFPTGLVSADVHKPVLKQLHDSQNRLSDAWSLQVQQGNIDADTVTLNVTAAKDGKKETLEANIVLVAAGACSRLSH